MKVNRRALLGMAATAAGAAVVGLGAQSRRIARPGVQLYTLRGELAKDFEGTLARVAALGYTEVEFHSYFDRSPRSVRAVLDRHGLTAPSTHVDLQTLTTRLPQVLETSRIIGHRYVVLPWLDDAARMDPAIFSRVADLLNRAGEAARQSGITMGYHNHHFEFAPDAGGVMPFDRLLATCDRSLVTFELDLAWITAAGLDSVAYFRRYPGRFTMVHVKGLRRQRAGAALLPIERLKPDLVDVGHDDVIDWARVCAGATEAGVRHFFVEHDEPPSPFESLRRSYEYVQALRF